MKAQINKGPRGVTWQEALEQWVESRQEGTQKDYRRIYAHFLDFCGKLPEEITGEEVRHWRDWLEHNDYAPSTIRTYMAILASFYDYAEVQGLVERNPVEPEFLPKARPYFSGRYLSQEEEEALLGVIDRETIWGRRDYALILFLLRSGRRTGEILGLRWGDFEVKKEGVWYSWWKYGNREKSIYRLNTLQRGDVIHRPMERSKLDWEVWAAITSYLKFRGRLEEIREEDMLFTPLTDVTGRVERLRGLDWHNQALSKGSVGRLIQMYARWAGLTAEEISPKALRYTAAVRMWNSGCDLETLREFMRFRYVDTARVFVKQLSALEVGEDKLG